MFLLLFFEVVSVRFWVTASGFRRLCADVTHPPPLSRGEIEMMFSFVNESFECDVSPLERGV